MLSGVFPMLVTPFADDGSVDGDDMLRLIDHAMAQGATGLAMLGLGGESGALTAAERQALAALALRHVRGAVPVIVGTTAETTAAAVELARHAGQHGAAALMVAPPSGGGLDAAGLGAHYAAVAEAAGEAAVMIQDAPAYIGTALPAGFVAGLARAHPNVRYLKAEGFPVIDAVAEAVEACHGTAMTVFGGNAGVHTIDALEAGAVGMIPGCECIPEHRAMLAAFAAGRRDDALATYRRVMPLLTYELQSLPFFIACNKALLQRRGVITGAAVRGRAALSRRSVAALFRYADEAGI